MNDCGIRALILDMDGVIWKENQPIGDLPAIFSAIQAKGLKLALATNNAVRTPLQVQQRMLNLGVALEEWQIITSALAAARLLKQRFPQGGKVFIVGEDGIRQAITRAGFTEAETDVVAVVAGLDRQISFEKLRRATLLIRSGAIFIGTNPDRTFPTPEGLIPGAGSLLALLETATDTAPIVAGKPQPALFELALERLGVQKHEALVVGDRLETDILGGQKAGFPTALVLSGIATQQEAEAWSPRPTWIAPCLGDLVDLL